MTHERIITNEFCHRGAEDTEGRKMKYASLFHLSSLCSLCLGGFLSVGCAPYVQSQVDLIEQSRKGVAMISQSLDAQAKTIDQFQQRQRTMIDDAFDTDVREQTSLDADWIIDHRIAYGMALDALNESRHQSQLSHQQDQRTLEAIQLALQKLEWLITLPTGR